MSVRVSVILALMICIAWYYLLFLGTVFGTLSFPAQHFIRGGNPCFRVVAEAHTLEFIERLELLRTALCLQGEVSYLGNPSVYCGGLDLLHKAEIRLDLQSRRRGYLIGNK